MTHSNHSVSDELRQRIRDHYLCDEMEILRLLSQSSNLSEKDRVDISNEATRFVNAVRESSDPHIMESFLAEYGLSTDEGVALMCLAEALLRVPDNESVDALIHDKIVPADWGKHLGNSSSSLVNASTWALMLTGKLIDDNADGLAGSLRAAVRRMGEPVIRTAVGQAIKEMGNQFVLGEDIDSALKNSEILLQRGYTYSYDMLGEAAMTEQDAKRYHLSYSEAIATMGAGASGSTVAENPGISVKLSALYPRYEFAQRENVMIELVARTRSLAMLAKSANMGFNIDAEEADRLDLSLDVIEAVLKEPSLAGWDGFGIVVQAYAPRAWFVIDWLYDLAKRLDRRLMVRLVKGAYWDTEVKRAQVNGLNGFPVFTRKHHTDVSYIACAGKLLGMTDRIYPQFATHNAHTIASILHRASDTNAFEFQRLHGMGEAVHQHVLKLNKTRCRIYAPVGAHEDLLAYLVRRLLENGANSSFVNQIVDTSISSEEIAADPFAQINNGQPALALSNSRSLYLPERVNSAGIDLTDPVVVESLDKQREHWKQHQWSAIPLVPGLDVENEPGLPIVNPANLDDQVGTVRNASVEAVSLAFDNAQNVFEQWSTEKPRHRADLLIRTSELFEQHSAELLSLVCREAGKTLLDGVAEIREAVDFLRYYAERSVELAEDSQREARGTIVCISPWNFPLAIFTGQIAAALATGNAVLAKPAEQTPLIATRAIQLFHQAGIPESVLQLILGAGSSIGATLTSDQRVSGVCFTGSTQTAWLINKSMATHCRPDTPLIAETGGLNAMVVDSTALPEQAVRDIIASAFQSAGQRCSALRVLLVQEDVADKLITMLKGAMDLLQVGDPWSLSTDIGPLIDKGAKEKISQHIANASHPSAENMTLVHQTPTKSIDSKGHYLAPTLLSLTKLGDLTEEIFGPVLHIVQFRADEFSSVLEQINESGYGLTFGLHTRVDERVQEAVNCIDAGNLYINRNQIGAVVGSQPFGGKALSGTGPKAGGPHYLLRFVRDKESASTQASTRIESTTVAKPNSTDNLSVTQEAISAISDSATRNHADSLSSTPPEIDYFALVENALKPLTNNETIDQTLIARALNYAQSQFHSALDLPGPTGESNRLGMEGAGLILFLDTEEATQSERQHSLASVVQALALGNRVVVISQSTELTAVVEQLKKSLAITLLEAEPDIQHLSSVQRIDAVICSAPSKWKEVRQNMASRSGPILPLVCEISDITPLINEKSLCIDTTAAGGNASLLAEMS